ncbi:MAG: acylphosphatase [Anaerolineales bacterium]
MQDPIQLHAWVEGRVQGVGFRYFVRQRASALPIAGWVRNMSDGRVEMLAEGRREDLEALLDAVKRGPTGSLVTEVKVEWRPASGGFTGFAVRPTD